MRGDGKDKFYRTLKLDEESRKTISEFNKLKRKMINETKNQKDKNETR